MSIANIIGGPLAASLIGTKFTPLTGQGWLDIRGGITPGVSEAAHIDWGASPIFKVPVGDPVDRRDATNPTGSRVPRVVSRSPATFPTPVFTPTLRGLPAQIQEVLRQGGKPVAEPRVVSPPPRVIRPSGSKAGHPEGLGKTSQTPATTTTRETTMDLGDILGTAVGLYKDYNVAKSVPQYIDARYGGQPVQQPADFNIPFVDVVTESPQKGMVWNPRANCGNGAWVKSRRRRRRRLATVSDIKDLAALKSVLGGGKAFETWIATHS